ncbi:MAG: diguanylate cyclase [Candidatus Electrothrix aestuarii]|uniref:diguanylate cyclase n=1 Tax=Candidatus Electrothrix aestuarii TaxID=3062594 RepID=A0AAU8M1F7_9BACT|nr:diguanylate cyclase [Candidatus Electrothrix aestuarii]WPD24174.1 MAG: diguanylate cyclase [Candidatus Electrothrix sp. GW3-3]
MKPEYQDSLIGIANRRYFDKQLKRAWMNAQKTENPLSLLFCDIDQFIDFHAHYDSPAADVCLRRVGRCLHSTLRRPTDLAARYEGERFAILLPYTDAHGALVIADRMLAEVRSLAIPHEYSDTASVVTISIGGHSLWPRPGLSTKTLVNLVDMRLFQAKYCGRNQSRISTACREELDE